MVKKGCFSVVEKIPRLCPPFYILSNERALSAETTKKPFRFVLFHVCDELIWVKLVLSLCLFDPLVSVCIKR